MGFFSDLKDDLSQAVNELIPEEELKQKNEETAADESEAENTAADGEMTGAAGADEVTADNTVNKFGADLSQMLDHVEELQEPEEETVYTAYTASAAEERKTEFGAASSKKPCDEVSVLTESMLINGNMATEGSLEVRGSIVGNVEALGKLNITGTIQGNSQAAEIYAEGAKITGELKSLGSIKIGQSSVIIGNIFANSAVVAGAVKGDIDVKGPVILDASAIVMGDIKSKSVQINNGAVIEGMCSQCYAEVNPTSFFDELKKMK